ncbi:EF-P beta-lysylation protein EpmB [Candidatus Pantoea edessiphila]|uniref:L-lysine 2,3-aminomutase n=1 Tax=Candidatus Pantoea edessiphila TaxID=2044610 RepID=A0A2P5SW23_9GAMM|nr:EF-P beta-lysylation protein EpmB [Candidatus Pantoea edessiphila]PPI86535.1 EF-P beta-lysylation protein EpmB [Candidatus Pantoea edessiphila]
MVDIITLKHYKKENWLQQLANVITEPKKLLKILELDNNHAINKYIKQKNLFPCRVPLSFVNRMKKNTITDPLLLQVLINKKELINTPGYSKDPLKEQNNKIPNVLHKYKNRALLLLKNSCAINCRYCFRRYFPYQKNPGNKDNWKIALQYIYSHSEINEIIFSGGDPLMAKDHELAWIIKKIENIPHIKKLRIHTRFPVVIPDRITNQLCQLLGKTKLNILLVTHINHFQEVNDEVFEAMSKLKKVGVTLLNQSVLLKGINDNLDVLIKLSDCLFDLGILPYYLHLLDKVQGTAHFFVKENVAIKLIHELSLHVSGYMIPKLVKYN